MASHEQQLALEVDDPDDPDIGFQAGFGFYLGLVAAGIVAIVGVVADVTTATLLGALPSTVTAVAIVGHIVAKRARGLPEWMGRMRRRRLAWYVAPLTFGATLAGALAAPIDVTARFSVLTIAFTLLIGVGAFGLDRLCRNRYVDAITDDDPAASWTWSRTAFGFDVDDRLGIAGSLLLILGGLYSVVAWGLAFGAFIAMYGGLFLLGQLDLVDWSNADQHNQRAATGRAHEAGVVIDWGASKRFVPWTRIADVRLTDDALVLERRKWVDLRCDRSEIDDPEAVVEAIERRRGTGETGSTALETAVEPDLRTEIESDSRSDSDLEPEAEAETELER